MVRFIATSPALTASDGTIHSLYCSIASSARPRKIYTCPVPWRYIKQFSAPTTLDPRTWREGRTPKGGGLVRLNALAFTYFSTSRLMFKVEPPLTIHFSFPARNCTGVVI